MFGREDLRSLSVNFPIAHPDLINLIHQLRDQIKMKARAAKTGDLAFGRQDDPRVFDGILEIVFSHAVAVKDKLANC